jgi:regulator of PEP synthase PpsR (kinase-PPPase family)
MDPQLKIVWILSDGTGRTASQLLKAASYQFEYAIQYRVVKDITTEEKIYKAIERIKKETGMIVYTIVSKSHRRILHRLAMENHILAVDIFGQLISTMEKFLQKVPLEKPGLTQEYNRDYFRMVDAVDFTIRHDDGKSLQSVDKADIILIGPSRVGKTPLSIYMAYMGWKVANIPIIPGSGLPEVLEKFPFKIFSLVIDAAQLKKRREDRISKLGNPEISGYTDLKTINEEIEQSKCMANYGKKWPVVDVSDRTIEDIAKEIIQLGSV